MSTETDLLRVIRDNPDEDTPRLMYADYLDEEGNSARAEFIRLQVERAQLPAHDPRRNAIEDREHELLAEHEQSWLGVAPDDMEELTEWEFERGFVNEVAATPVFMRGPGADLCAAHSIRRWRVTSGDTGTNFPEDLKEAGQRGWATRLETLDLSGWYSGLGELAGFLGSRSNFEQLRELNLTGRGPLEPLPEIIEFAPFRDQLRRLYCGQGGYDGGRLDVPEFVRALGAACRLEELGVSGAMLLSDDLRDLLAANIFASLTSLDVSQNQIDGGVTESFRSALFRLHELDLSATPLGGTALDQLLGSPSLASLRILHLNQCGSTAANIRELAASPFWTQAEELRMQMGMMWNEQLTEEEAPAEAEADPALLAPLFQATGPKNLQILDLAGNGLRDPGVELLCSAPWAASLAYLDLSMNYLSDEALRTIARSGRFQNLRTLHLNFNSAYHLYGAGQNEMVTDAGLRALADCPDLANLRVLSVSGTRITAAGVDAILNSPHWRLSGLRISQCQLGSDVIEVLSGSPRLARLEILDLSGNDEIGAGRLKSLAESEYLCPLTELNISGLGGEATKVRTALRERLGHRLTG